MIGRAALAIRRLTYLAIYEISIDIELNSTLTPFQRRD